MSFDIVITWCNWANKNFCNKMIEAGGNSEGCEEGDFLELKYLIRSIDKNISNFNKIYIVISDNHPPPFYLKETNNLIFIKHSQIVNKKENLPLVHRESIVAHLHKIPNLKKYYFYFQDDLFVNNSKVFDEIIECYEKKLIHVTLKKKLKKKYDVNKSCGLWLQSTVNSNKLFNNLKNPFIFEHHVQFFDREIIEELEEKYKYYFTNTQSYKNKLLEKNKEPYLICITTIFVNFIIHVKKFKLVNMNKLNFGCVRHNFKKNEKLFKNELIRCSKLNIFCAQGDGISDEYPKNKMVHNIFYDFIDKLFPNKTVFEI